MHAMSVASGYQIKKVADDVYIALATTTGKIESNALIVLCDREVILAGAHLSKDAINELQIEIAKLSPFPLGHVILTHHHNGYNYLDIDIPLSAEIVTSWQAWKFLNKYYKQDKRPVVFFETGTTINIGNKTIVLSNIGRGHSEGDVIVYLPESKILFVSDLAYNDNIGFMGDGYMKEWVVKLQELENVDANIVIPGAGNVMDTNGLKKFRVFLQDFSTEILKHLEKGDNMATTKKTFSLKKYSELPGFVKYYDVNIERVYLELSGK
jgi:glyoxylase-like metal-dependent hydrolase (beta-lactamase superfamily II)